MCMEIDTLTIASTTPSARHSNGPKNPTLNAAPTLGRKAEDQGEGSSSGQCGWLQGLVYDDSSLTVKFISFPIAWLIANIVLFYKLNKKLKSKRKAQKEVSLTIDPRNLSNPDTNLRYTIPQTAIKLSNNRFNEKGFDYDGNDNMIIFLLASELSEEEVENLLNKTLDYLNIELHAVKINIKV